MKLAVIADVHGNLPALEAVLEDLSKIPLDGLIVAGDVAVGPQVNQAFDLITAFGGTLSGFWMIQGNNEEYLVELLQGRAPAAWYTLMQWGMIRWTAQHLSRETRDLIFSLPSECRLEVTESSPLRVVHGAPGRPSELVFPDRNPVRLTEIMGNLQEQVLICAHTHRPWTVRRDGWMAMNPGAVCSPLNGEIGAQYALLTWRDEGWEVEHRTIPYNLSAVRRIFIESGILQASGGLAMGFLRNIETGKDYSVEFLSQVYNLLEQAGLHDRDAIPDEIWQLATDTFDWEE